MFLPPLVAILLSIPCFRFPYMWDDFVFLGIAQTFRISYVLPNPESIFYRPVSREVYFGLLSLLHTSSAFVAHLLNAALLTAAIVLLMSFATRLCGRRIGILSGLVFASMGVVPVLIGWIATAQDLFAIVFVLVALRLQQERRPGPAALAMMGAALSKESALFVVPVLVLYPWILGTRPYRLWRQTLWYGAAVAAWAALHPGLRLLAARGFRGQGTSYLAVDSGGKMESLWKSVLTLLNLPAGGLETPWPPDKTQVLILAGLAAMIAVWKLGRRGRDVRSMGAGHSPARAAALVALVAVLPTLFTTAVVRYWAPLYSALPAIGSSVLLAMLLARLRPRYIGIAMAGFLVLGVWSRGLRDAPLLMHEENLRQTAGGLTRVERGFKRLHATFPSGSTVYLSVLTTGPGGVGHHLRELNALRIWYSDPTISTLRFTDRRRESGPEFLFWVSSTLDVVEIDPRTLEPHSSGEKPSYPEYQKTIRHYTLGLAGAGLADRAVSILLGMPKMIQQDAMLDRRMAAMVLLAEGREAEARPIINSTPAFERADAIGLIGAMLAQPIRGKDFVEPALAAFGFAASDMAARRELMRWMADRKYYPGAVPVATRILALQPGDPESRALLEAAARAEHRERWFGGGPRDAL